MSLKFYRDTRYLVSEDGEVINNETGKVLSQMLDLGGYKYVNIYDPKKHTIRVHKMVAEVFLGKSDKIVNHIDGIKTNNHYTNLEYTTHSDNTSHAYSLGLMKKGSEKSWAKLNEDDVSNIKRMFVDGVSSSEIAEKYNVTVGTISNIRSGRAWKDVSPELKWVNTERQRSTRKIIAEDIPTIRSMFKQGMTDTAIAKIYGCNRGTIFQIRSGRNWKNY